MSRKLNQEFQSLIGQKLESVTNKNRENKFKKLILSIHKLPFLNLVGYNVKLRTFSCLDLGS